MTTIQLVLHYLQQKGLKAGDRIPPERMLSEELQLTRSKLRTALSKLEKDGIVRRHVGQGTFICRTSGDFNDQPIESSVRHIETNPTEIIEARLTLEPKIVSYAAMRATGTDIDRLSDVLAKQARETSWSAWSRLDQEFHLTIAECARNSLLMGLLRQILKSTTPRNWGGLSELSLASERRDEVMNEHMAILEAIRIRDSRSASALMEAHLDKVHATLLGLSKPD